MATPEVIVGLKRWFRSKFDRAPDMEITAKGVLIPGAIRGAWEFREEFNEFKTAASGVFGWHLDEVNGGTYPVIADAHGGIFEGTPDNAQGDNFHYHWANNTTVCEVWKPAAGKRFWMATRFKVEDADQNMPMIGAHVSQDDPWNTEPSDQAMFRTLSADKDALQFAIGKTNSTEVTIALGDLEDDTWVTCVAFYDGADTVHAFRYNDAGELVTSGYKSVTSSAQGDLLPDTEMAPAFGMEANDTGTDKLSIDFIYIAQER